MVKPFSPAEMVARVRSHIRIHEQLLGEREAKERAIQIRDLEIFPQERRVYRKQREVSLTNKEFELLLFLIENPNIVFSKVPCLTESGDWIPPGRRLRLRFILTGCGRNWSQIHPIRK